MILFYSYKCTPCLVNPIHRDGVLQLRIIGSQRIRKRKTSWSVLRGSSLISLPMKCISGVCPKLGKLGYVFYLSSKLRDRALGPCCLKQQDSLLCPQWFPRCPLTYLVVLSWPVFLFQVSAWILPFSFPLYLNLGLGCRIFHFPLPCCLNIK